MRRFIKTELGFSIIQIIVVLGLMAISMMVTVDMLTQHNKQLLTTRILISRDSVVNIIKLNAMKVSVLKKTAETDAVNNLFHHCVFGKNQDSTVTVNGCLGGGIEHRLKLIDLSGAIVAGPAARDTFPADPLYYGSDGSVCSGNISRCPIQAEVVFSATCPGASPPVNCDQAATVVVKYIISQNQAAAYQAFSSLKKLEGSVTRNVADIVAITTGLGQSCAPYCIMGINPDGSLLCHPP